MLKRSFEKMTFFIRDFLISDKEKSPIRAFLGAAVEKIHDNGQELAIAGRISSCVSKDTGKQRTVPEPPEMLNGIADPGFDGSILFPKMLTNGRIQSFGKRK